MDLNGKPVSVRVSQDTQTAAASCHSADWRKKFLDLDFSITFNLDSRPKQASCLCSLKTVAIRLAGITTLSVSFLLHKSHNIHPQWTNVLAHKHFQNIPSSEMPEIHKASQPPIPVTCSCSIGLLARRPATLQSGAQFGETQWPSVEKRKKETAKGPLDQGSGASSGQTVILGPSHCVAGWAEET